MASKSLAVASDEWVAREASEVYSRGELCQFRLREYDSFSSKTPILFPQIPETNWNITLWITYDLNINVMQIHWVFYSINNLLQFSNLNPKS
jgi:hypothetical protein